MTDINPIEYYKSRGFVLNGRNVKCPFHDDKVPSMSIDRGTGLWFCHSGCGGGNIIQFESRLKGIDTKQAYAELCKEFNIDNNLYIDIQLVDQFHTTLINNQKAIDKLADSRGIKLNIIKKYKIGLDERLTRLTIPIFRGGFCINIRKYQSGAVENKVIGIDGHNAMALFPYDNLTGDTIYLMEGEMDCLLALQLGLNAITVTSGAGSWNADWNDYFNDRTVVLCYDIDDAGRKGAEKVIAKLNGHAKSIKNVELPIKTPANGDFTDYIMTHEFTIEDFNILVNNTKDITEERDAEVEALPVSLTDSSNAIYYGKYLETQIMVAGKETEPYNVPQEYKIKCKPKASPRCGACRLNALGEMTFTVKPTSEDILKLININEFQLMGVLRELAGITCKTNTAEIINKQSVEEIIAIPEITYAKEDVEYIKRRLYYAGHGVKMNKQYVIKGYNYTHPADQKATLLINSAKATQGTLDPTLITKEIKDELKIFQTDNIGAKLKEIYDDFAYNVTHIFGRSDMLLAIDLAYHSVLHFDFCGIYQHKGRADVLVIGDTRCGKSISIEGLIKHYRAGEIIGGDNVSFAGLVGGAQQVGKGWVVTWGKIPLNNGMLVAIDELSSMEPEAIGLLSGIRTTGIAEITKIAGGKTQANTRLICFSNPRTGRKLSTYSKGVLAIKELIGKAEDISRFDLAVAVADSDIKQTDINDCYTRSMPHKYKSDACHNLILWAWTRKKDDIVFTEGTEKAILQLALDLTEQYDSDIPLVTPAEQRIKLARLSISLAIRLFSTDDSGEKVIVRPEHAEYVYLFLKRVYSAPAMGYDLHSEYKTKAERYIRAGYKDLMEAFKQFPDWKRLKDMMLEYELVRKVEIELQMKWTDTQVKEYFGWCGKNRLMFSVHTGYAKHPLFIQMLKEMGDTDIIDKAKEIFQ
jgi:hypothetical protein